MTTHKKPKANMTKVFYDNSIQTEFASGTEWSANYHSPLSPVLSPVTPDGPLSDIECGEKPVRTPWGKTLNARIQKLKRDEQNKIKIKVFKFAQNFLSSFKPSAPPNPVAPSNESVFAELTPTFAPLLSVALVHYVAQPGRYSSFFLNYYPILSQFVLLSAVLVPLSRPLYKAFTGDYEYEDVPELVPQSEEIEYKEACKFEFLKSQKFHSALKDLHEQKVKDKLKSKEGNPKKKCRRKKLEPQVGFIDACLLSRFKKAGFNADILSHVENATIAALACTNAVSTAHFFQILFLYFKTMYSPSVVDVARQYVCRMFDSLKPQSGVYGSDHEYPEWLKEMKNLSTTWTLALHAEGFTKIAKLLSLCVALGLCQASSIVPTVGGIELFTLPAVAKVTSAVSFIDAIFDLVIHFAEGGYVCFTQGSLKPLLYGSIDAQRLSDNFHKCMRCSNLHGAGNLSQEDLDVNGYDRLLQETITLCERLMAGARGTMERQIFMKQLDKLNLWKCDLSETRLSGGLRVSPFCVGLFGGTSVGKSTIVPLLMVSLLKANGFDASDENIVTINESDKYMSNWKSFVNGCILDDIGNTKAMFVDAAPSDRIIQIVNNARAYAVMAGVEEKGKVAIEPKVVLITKNVKDSGATVYSNEPASIARRENFIITVEVKPQYAMKDMIDPIKASEASVGELFPDIWNLTVETAFPKEGTLNQPATIGYETVVDARGLILHNVSLREVARHLIESSQKHFARQIQVVENAKNLKDKIQICVACSMPMDWHTCVACGKCEVDDSIESELAESPFQPILSLEGNSFANSDIGVLVPHSGIFTPRTIPEHAVAKIRGTLVPRTPWIAWFKNSFMSLATTVGFGPIVVGSYAMEKSKKFFTGKLRHYAPLSVGIISRLEIATTDALLERLELLAESPYACWTNWVPEWLFQKPIFKEVITAAEWKTVRSRVIKRYWKAFALTLTPLIPILAVQYASRPKLAYAFFMKNHAFLTKFLSASMLMSFLSWPLREVAVAVEEEKACVYEELIAKRKNFISPLAKRIRDQHLSYIVGGSVALAGIYSSILLYRQMFKLSEQGSLEPVSESQITARDAEVNCWLPVAVEVSPGPPASEHSSFEDVLRLVRANLAHMSFSIGDKTFHCDAFFPKSNVALLPRHMWKEPDLTCLFVRREGNVVGANFRAKISRKFAVDIPNSDLCLVWVPSGGDWRDLTKFLPFVAPGRVPARLVYRNKDAVIQESKLSYTPNSIITALQRYNGGTYTLEWPTFAGLCMATLVSEDRAPKIIGFHLSGNTGKPDGASGILLAGQMDLAFKQLAELEYVLLSKSDVPHDTTQYDVQFFESSEIHHKSATRFLPENATCRVYGTVKGKSTYRSEVVSSPLSQGVKEVCGVPQLWGPPPFNVGYKWQESLEHSCLPLIGFEAGLVIKSARCYEGEILLLFEKHPSFKSSRPLNEVEIVSGIDNKRFIDAMKSSTSIGYPLSGPKSGYMTDLPPTDQHRSPRTLFPIFWEKSKQVEQAYLKGERTTQVFKACFKDEATLLLKNKVRVFQASTILLQIGIRKYYLPLARILSVCPLTSECAVGINAESPEWDEMDKHITKHGANRILAGDYSKYDLKMPAQLMFVAFRIFINMARKCNYSPDDICIMEGYASEVCYAYTAYNGDLIKFIGSNPSGQNLTVYINSMVNSLLLRCAFYDIYPRGNFRLAVSPMTYGDDVTGSVSPKYPKYNHKTVAAFYARHELKFTMPDKESEAVEYLHIDETDFLKRRSYFHAELGCYVGILDDASIFKSLHCQMRSTHITQKQIAGQNIDGALRSWFFHGRKVFEMRQSQMQQVAERAEVQHMTLTLNKTFDEYVSEWWNIHRSGKPYEGPYPTPARK